VTETLKELLKKKKRNIERKDEREWWCDV